MADSININKASLEELIQIKNIGPKRAAIIIKTREKKGNLTLEDLKLFEGIPNTIWNPLIQNGDITMDKHFILLCSLLQNPTHCIYLFL
jgi:competence ComEA-like helix-hairpin-helix protein